MFRGYDPYLVSRVSRAGSHYLDTDTLRFFNAYGGTHFRVSDDITLIVESVEHPSQGRVYRVVSFLFYRDAGGRERVEVERLTDFLPRHTANRELSRLGRALRESDDPALFIARNTAL